MYIKMYTYACTYIVLLKDSFFVPIKSEHHLSTTHRVNESICGKNIIQHSKRGKNMIQHSKSQNNLKYSRMLFCYFELIYDFEYQIRPSPEVTLFPR